MTNYSSMGDEESDNPKEKSSVGAWVFERRKASCQGCSLRLTGTRGLVGESGVEGVMEALGS